MDDEPMWAADRIVAPTLDSAITILETANEFAIKDNHLTLVKGNQFDGRIKTDPYKHIHEFIRIALFNRLLGEIPAFSQRENKTLTDAWLHMKELLRNCHGHNLSNGNIIKIFYHSLNETTQEVLNDAADGIFLYKTPNQAYQLLEEKVLLKLDWAKNQKTKPSLKKLMLLPIKNHPRRIFLAEFDEFMAMTADENSEFESDIEEPPFEKITFDTDYKVKLLKNLKPLPDNLEYAFLEELSFLLVIISSQLSEQNKNKLVSTLESHKQAFAWKTTDIPKICSSFCKHKIQLLEDKKQLFKNKED
nr:reverse transcriptase domain-containing protein [Tanacetum cinerariifolium]